MEDRYAYQAEYFSAELPAREYVARFRDAARVGAACRACPRYGRYWGCPPFGDDAQTLFRPYRTALILAVKITPAVRGLPVSQAGQLMRPERQRLEERLLALERESSGRAFAQAGECLHCAEGSCTRPEAKPCRHPERVRPSLEACGFDVVRTAAELFGIELQWGRGGRMPEYLTLVCGYFHNGQTVP